MSGEECGLKVSSASSDSKDEPFYSMVFFGDKILVALRSTSTVMSFPQSEADDFIRKIREEGVSMIPVSLDYKTSGKVLPKQIGGLTSVFDVMVCAYVLNRVSGSDVSFETIYERTLGLSYPIRS